MTAPLRVAAFVVLLVVAFGAAAGVGRAVGPLDATAEPAHAMDDAHTDDGHGDHAAAGEIPAGLQASVAGYTLSLASDLLPAGRRPLDLTITGPDGHPVTSYDVQHERELHLIVVRRDLAGFQHVHPTLDPATGVWTTDVRLTPGAWRVFADVAPTGADPMLLGTDLQVPGAFRPEPLGPEDRVAEVGPYQVVLNGALQTGETELTLTVSRDGRPVTDLQPYLGAYGHLVALRDGDLAYLHVHPDAEPGAGEVGGPDVVFHATFPSAGSYRLFLDFRHRGVVRTAVFTVDVTGPGEGATHEH
jgi:hypothetical protein